MNSLDKNEKKDDGERKVNYQTIVITEVGDDLHVYGQCVDEGPKLDGLMTQLREERHSIEAKTEIYIANTIGELGLFYRLSPIAFVGGTLIPHGGQNLLEAAKLDCAIIHGPSTDNFTTITKEMSKVDGSILVHNKIELAEAVSTLMSDEARRQAQIIAASNIAKDKIQNFVGSFR